MRVGPGEAWRPTFVQKKNRPRKKCKKWAVSGSGQEFPLPCWIHEAGCQAEHQQSSLLSNYSGENGSSTHDILHQQKIEETLQLSCCNCTPVQTFCEPATCGYFLPKTLKNNTTKPALSFSCKTYSNMYNPGCRHVFFCENAQSPSRKLGM